MKIENRIKALEELHEDPETRAILQGNLQLMTPEQLQNYYDELMEKLFATDISMLQPERAIEIRELRDLCLKNLRDQIEINLTCPGAYRKLTQTELQILAQNG